MKKINTNKIVALLAVLCMITSAFVGSTLAKYTTEGKGTDSARVAKFGVVVNATSDSAFKTEYASDTAAYTDLTVKSDTTDKLVAPGTTGTLTDVKLTGTPEVAVNVTYTADLSLTDWTTDGTTEYCPLVITVEGTEYTCESTVSAFESAVEAAINGCSKDYAVNTDLSNIGNDAPSVSWKWAIDGDNVKDTALGDRAAAGNAAGISLTLTTTVTQID